MPPALYLGSARRSVGMLPTKGYTCRPGSGSSSSSSLSWLSLATLAGDACLDSRDLYLRFPVFAGRRGVGRRPRLLRARRRLSRAGCRPRREAQRLCPDRRLEPDDRLEPSIGTCAELDLPSIRLHEPVGDREPEPEAQRGRRSGRDRSRSLQGASLRRSRLARLKSLEPVRSGRPTHGRFDRRAIQAVPACTSRGDPGPHPVGAPRP